MISLKMYWSKKPLRKHHQTIEHQKKQKNGAVFLLLNKIHLKQIDFTVKDRFLLNKAFILLKIKFYRISANLKC